MNKSLLERLRKLSERASYLEMEEMSGGAVSDDTIRRLVDGITKRPNKATIRAVEALLDRAEAGEVRPRPGKLPPVAHAAAEAGDHPSRHDLAAADRLIEVLGQQLRAKAMSYDEAAETAAVISAGFNEEVREYVSLWTEKLLTREGAHARSSRKASMQVDTGMAHD